MGGKVDEDWKAPKEMLSSEQGTEEPGSLLLHKFDILFWSSFGKTVISLN